MFALKINVSKRFISSLNALWFRKPIYADANNALQSNFRRKLSSAKFILVGLFALCFYGGPHVHRKEIANIIICRSFCIHDLAKLWTISLKSYFVKNIINKYCKKNNNII